MPTEIRRLVFSHAESTEALSDHGKKFDAPIPAGKLIRAQLKTMEEKDKFQMVNLTFYDDMTLSHKVVSMTTDFVRAALIDFCATHRIVLPRDAEKTLDVTEFNFCLDIKMDKSAGSAAPPLTFDE